MTFRGEIPIVEVYLLGLRRIFARAALQISPSRDRRLRVTYGCHASDRLRQL